MHEVILKRFEHPDEVRTFDKGRFELVHVGGPQGLRSCAIEHVGLVLSGRATAAMDDGSIIEMKPGDLFYIASGHDSWVVGDEPYVSLHFLGAVKYAQVAAAGHDLQRCSR